MGRRSLRELKAEFMEKRLLKEQKRKEEFLKEVEEIIEEYKRGNGLADEEDHPD